MNSVLRLAKNQVDPRVICANSLASGEPVGVRHITWILFNIIDMILTYIGIAYMGANEINPFLSNFSLINIAIIKMTVVIILMLYVNKRDIAIGSTIVGLVCLWNILIMIQG